MPGVPPEASSLIERLRRALGPTFRVDGEVAQGGMGTVFRAQDLSLNRPVAVKILPPEASAEQVERFHREAQVLAQLSHPCIVPVYQVSSQDQDLNYYIMQWMEGETVQTRLSRGPMSPREAVDMGIDLLKALAISHKYKVIHRDVKPANVFLVDQRTVLGDFGIAKPLTGERTVLTAPAQMIGTPAYMAPEQWEGGQVTESTDLYAVGLLLYEAMCGKRLPHSSIDAPDWSKIPRRLAQVLRRALAKEPTDRWLDAQSFISALRAAIRPSFILWVAAAVVTLAVAGFIYWLVTRPGPPGTIAILPFNFRPGVDTAAARELESLLLAQLNGVGGLTIVGPNSKYFSQANTRLSPTMENSGSQIRVGIRGQKGLGNWLVQVSGSRDSLWLISNELATLVMVQLDPSLNGREIATLSKSYDANREFAAGEAAFRNVRWAEAEERYKSAEAIDSGFALAIWRLANVRRWRRLVPGIDLKPLLQRYSERLSPLDRLLLQAEVERDVTSRFRLYEQAVQDYPRDGMARLFFGDELMHRGPLAGHSLNEALIQFGAATDNDSTLAAAWFHIGWINIRLGDSLRAKAALDKQLALAAPENAVADIDLSYFLGLTYQERFEPEKVAANPTKITPVLFNQIVRVFRWAISFDIPAAQYKYGRMIDSLAPSEYVRASAQSGEGIALVALGQPESALAHFDQAQVLRATPEADLHRAEWRVIPPAMGWYALPADKIEQGRRLLTSMLASDSLAPRAAWALALDAAATRDWPGFTRYYQVLRDRPGEPLAERLRVLLDADTLGRHGAYAEALRISVPLLAFDSAGRFGDPFARSVIRLERGGWHEQTRQFADADLEWSWYENSDLAGEPTGEVQPIEVDWAVGNIARLSRARVNLATGHLIERCAQLRRVAELWANGEEQFRAAADSARAEAGKPPCTP